MEAAAVVREGAVTTEFWRRFAQVLCGLLSFLEEVSSYGSWGNFARIALLGKIISSSQFLGLSVIVSRRLWRRGNSLYIISIDCQC